MNFLNFKFYTLNSKKGFTLIEVLIVVAIVGILASVVLVGLGPVQRRGRDARRISDLRQTQTGLELYYNKYGEYPTGVTSWSNLATKLVGSQAGLGISNIPKDPRSPTVEYKYYTGDGSSYVIGAKMEDPENPAIKEGLQESFGDLNCGIDTGWYCLSL